MSRRQIRTSVAPVRLHAKVLLLIARLAHLRFKPLCLALKRRQALLSLRGAVARISPRGSTECIAWRRLASSCRSTLKTSSAAVRASCWRASTFW